MMGAPNLIAENMDCGLSYSVISYLKKLSQQVKSQLISHNRNFTDGAAILTAAGRCTGSHHLFFKLQKNVCHVKSVSCAEM